MTLFGSRLIETSEALVSEAGHLRNVPMPKGASTKGLGAAVNKDDAMQL